MRHLFISMLLLPGAFGCATAPNHADSLDRLGELRASLEARDAQVATLEAAQAELAAGDRRLRAELALSRADARELRAEVEMRRQTHSIRGRDHADDSGWVEQDGFAANANHATEAEQDSLAEPEAEDAAPEATPEAEAGPRPMLRLYGAPAAMVPRGQATLPTATAQPATLSPALRAASGSSLATGSLAAPMTPSAAPDDAAVHEYRQALAMVRDRRLDAALPALERFVAAHPQHPYADNALYWRGEVFFLRHQFPQALREYTRLLSNYPRGNKVADALLRTGMCHLRMGDASRARASFRRLRESFPQSVAARRASREDAS